MSQPALLICTVGGTPQAVAASIKGCRPERIVFVTSPQTTGQIEEAILPLLRKENIEYSPGQYEITQVRDAQELASCVEKVRELEAEVDKWLSRGDDYRVVADFTAGTKLMAAALALVARRWHCTYSYVAGSKRNRGGTGVVIDGTEQCLHTENPWELLGYQALEDAAVLFDKGDYEAAMSLVAGALPKVEQADMKSELNAVRVLSEAYLRWDLFDHAAARTLLGTAERNANNLRRLLPTTADGVLAVIRKNLAFLKQFQPGTPGRHSLVDLCANAGRCADRGRYDDAVARLYRAVEVTAQLRLYEGYAAYSLADGGVPVFSKLMLDRVPEPLRAEWSPQSQDGCLRLGLQDNYRLLRAMGDEAGKRFEAHARMDGALSARNQSILAHGFVPVGRDVFQTLWGQVLDLAEISAEQMPRFPRLGVRETRKR